MKQVTLPGGRSTTQLGFGCAYLNHENAAVLDAVRDAGIGHIDVARAYGRGLTEGIVGRFLARSPASITVTGKYGIRAPFSHAWQGQLRRALRPLLRQLRRSGPMSQRIDATVGSFVDKAVFTGEDALRSLALSLRNLRREHLDLFLMHEAAPGELGDPTLLAALEQAHSQGRIGALGVGGRAELLPQLLATCTGFCNVLQHDWTPAEPAGDDGRFHVVYRVHGGPLAGLPRWLADDFNAMRQWSEQTGADLASPGTLRRLLLKAALELRPDALVLFSSTQPAHVYENVAVAGDARLAAPARVLARLAGQWLATRAAATAIT